MRKLTLLITMLFLSLGMAWAQTNSNGSLVTFTNVQKNGNEFVLYITDSGVLDFSPKSAAELGEAAQFRATKQSNGKWTFYNEAKQLYMIWRGNDSGYNNNAGVLKDYNATYCDWSVVKSRSLSGAYRFCSMRSNGTTEGSLVILSDGSRFDKFGNSDGYADGYSNQYRIDVVDHFGFEPAKDYASINKWYYLTFRPDWNRKLYYDGTSNVLDASKTTIDANDKDAYSWAFIGNPFDGYKVVNKKAGEGKYLNAANNGGIVGTAEHVFTLTVSSHATNGFFMAGNGKERFNLQGDKVKYWSGADVGSTFVATLRNAKAELQASIANANLLLINYNSTVGYITADSKSAIETVITNAEAAISNQSGYEQAEAAIRNAIAKIETIQPETDKYYTIVSNQKNYAAGGKISVGTQDNGLIWNSDMNVSKWFKFVDAGNDKFYLYNVKTGLYLSTNGKQGTGRVYANATTTTDAKAVTITNMGKGNIVKIVPEGGDMIHAQKDYNHVVAWVNNEVDGASAWTIVEVENPGVAYIDNTNYATLAEAVAVWKEGKTINLIANTDETIVLPKGMKLDVIKFNGFTAPNVTEAPTVAEVATLAELQAALAAENELPIIITAEIVIPEGTTVELDLNGKAITGVATSADRHIYALRNNGNLTIKDSKGNGSISARGIYNGTSGENTTAVLVVEGGTFYALDANGGASIFNYAKLTVNGGTFDGQVAALNGESGEVVINGGTFRSTDNYVIQNKGYKLTIKKATVDRGFGAVGCYSGTTVINDGTFLPTGKKANTCHVVYVAAAADVTINGGTFKMNYPANAIPDSGSAVASYNNGKLSITGGSFTAHFDNVSPVELSTSSEITGGSYYNHSGVASTHSYVTNFVKAGYELGADGTVVAKPVAEVNGVKYTTFAEAAAAAQAGNEIKLLADIDGDIEVPAGVTLNGNGFAVNGVVTALGEITFAGVTKATNFGVANTSTVVNIPAGASLQLTGTGRMVIGHGCTFNITGAIADNAAKTADKATLTPSLVMPGASFTGAGVTFNVTNAYVCAPSSYCSSSKSASGTFDFNITNSIWESAGKLAFEEQSVNAKVDFALVNSVLTTGSHLVFGTASGEEGVVIDNSLVNEGTSRQLENRSTMTIKNGSVVNGAVATSSNAINPGTIIVENATYAVTGEFSGAAERTGTLIIKKGANVSVGSIKAGANVTVDAEGMTAGDEINFTANLSQFTGTLSVINNDKLEAKIVDGKIVLVAKPVAKIGEQGYATLEAAFAAATDGQTITLVDDAAPALTSQRAITKAAVIDLGDKTLTLTEDDLYFGTTTFKNGTIVVDPSVKPSTAVFWMFANQTLTFDNVKIVATGVTGTCLIGLDGNNSDLNIINGSEILVENTTALDLDIICVNASTGNDIKVENSKVNVTNLDGRVFFRGNYTVKDSEVNLAGITKAGFRIEAGQTLAIEGTSKVNIEGEPRDGGIHLTDLSATYTKAETATVTATVNEPKVAKVGENTYRTLAQAVAAVEDGGTIILIANETFTKNNRYNNGGYWDGLGYSGDKSFTIDLGGFTIGQDGALNDYLMWFKNDGAKANTITLKNGILDAGTTAYCALATASSNAQNITVNLENIKVINNISNGATLKIRAGAELNVKAGTEITGKDSYLGIECWAATVNIYDGAKINMNGTSSYCGCLVGASGNGTVNVYGGEGQSKSGGFIAMTSGGTINISGGEWIANSDGTYANSNKSVLVAQSAKRAKSIVNVTGGTFKGGYNCYGDAAGDAQINIKGGNFNANPTSYVAEDYIAVENNGVWTVEKATAKIGKQGYATLEKAFKAAKAGDVVTVFEGTYAMPAMKAGITVVGQGNVMFKGTLTGTLENLTMKNIHIKGGNAQRWAYAKGNLVFENVTFEATSVYALHFDGITAGATLSYKNCTIIGWAAMSGSPASCKFDGCTFNGNGTYGLIRTYFDATINNCTFDVANVNTTDAYEDGIHAVGGVEVTVTNCTNKNGAMEDLVNVHGASVVTVDGVAYKNVAKVGDNYYATFAEAYTAAQAGETVTMLADLNMSEILVLDKAITLDGNGKKLTSTAGRAINVSGADGVTIKNLTINASGERAINVIQGATNVTIDGVTATAANYTVNVASSAPNAVVAIKNSTLNGLCTVNVSAAGAQVTVDNSTVNCNDNNTTAGEAYAALSLNKEAVGGSIVATNSTIKVTEGSDSMKGRNGAEDGTVTINGYPDGVDVMVAIIEYAGSTNYHAFATIDAAIDFAKVGETIKLLRNVTVAEKITIAKSITLDGNGKTITYTGSDRAIDVPANADAKVNVTIENLTVNCTASYCQRGINYNDDGALKLNNVTVKGTNVTYALNLPGSSDNCEVAINNSSLTGNIALNVWGEKSVITATNSEFVSVDKSTAEGYVAISLNNDGAGNAATGSVVTINGGKIIARDDKGEPSTAVRVETVATVNVSEDTEVVGSIKRDVVIVTYEGSTDFYSFDNLQSAINKAIESKGTVVLLDNITIAEKIIISASVVIDLNGKTVSGTCNAGQSSLVYVENNAALTVKDDSEAKTGKLTYAAGSSNVGWTVDVKGALTLESGTIELTGSWSIGYAVDVRPNSWGTEYKNATKFTMNGGKLVSSDGAVRVASSSAAEHKAVAASFVMNGGVIDAAWDGVFVQQSDAIYDVLNFTINGGTIESDLNPVRVYGPAPTGYVTDTKCMTINFNGGTMDYTGSETYEWVIEGILRVGGGSSIETITENGTIAATAEFANANTLPDGYVWEENAEGDYVAVELPKVAKVGEVEYTSLADAIAAADNATVTVLTDIALTETVVVPADKTVVLDLNGKVVSQEKACTASYEMIKNLGNLTITDGTEAKAGKLSFKDTSDGDPSFGWGSYTVRNEGTLVVENGTIEHLGEQSAHCIMAIFQYSGSTTINGGTISTPNYRSVRLWKGDMTINGGTFDGQVWVQAVDNSADLAINGGTFEPNGGDASAVFVTNSEHDAELAVTNGTFNGKIGCSAPSKLAGAITGGQFTEAAKNATNADLIANYYYFGDTVDANGYYNVEKDPKYIPELVIDDAEGKDFDNDSEKIVGTLTYKRGFVEGYWNSLFVPFEIPMSMLSDYDVAYINDMHSYDKDYNGVIEEFGLEVIYIKDETATLNASHPYVIRPKNAEAATMKLVLEDATLFSSKEQTDVTCSSAYMNFTFKGSYSKIAVSEKDRYYILTLDENGEQTFGYAAAGSTLNPFRFYFTMESRGGSYVKVDDTAFKSVRIYVQGEGDTTGIVGTEFDTNGEELIYDLQGRRVLEPKKGGLYIINGKKVYYNK